jgi:Ca-activated chloride channel homolog
MFLLTAALCACQRTDSPSAASADPAALAADAALAGDKAAIQKEAERYYDALVKRYGQDYAACGPSEQTLPSACAEPGQVSGAKAGARSNVLLMLDASGSMAGRVGGETKMAAAQAALIDFTRKLSDSADVALRVYGHTGSNADSGKAESCAGSELLYPFQKLDARKFESAIRSFKPTGWTPIAASLDAAAGDFAKAARKDGANVVYVVSDGIETCDADPVQAARRLHESDIDVVVNVIGFDVDAQAARQLQAVAKAGGGEYLSARTRTDLNRIFNERWSQAQERWNCVWNEQQSAWNDTWKAQQDRWNCLWNKSQKEWNDIWQHSQQEWNAQWKRSQSEYAALSNRLNKDGSVDPDERNARLEQARAQRDGVQELARAKRDFAQEQAREKRDGIQEDARTERDRVQESARERRDEAQDAARDVRDRAQQAAREQRDGGR